MPRRRSSSIAANPVLIGAATTLVILVAVFLSYNANNGLPFVPTYGLYVDVPSAANLTKGNDVRIGGARVGVVNQITPIRRRDGAIIARLHVKLEQIVKPLPRDSTVLVRPVSALGLKYVEITKGTSKDGYPEGAIVPERAATPAPVEFDDFLNMFDDKTRKASQQQLIGLGDALAGRGQDLHVAIEDFNPLLRQLTPAMANLADPRTHLAGFFGALGRTSAQLAPVAENQAQMFRNLDTTFTALASVARPYLQDSISGGPAALDAVTRELPRQQALLTDSTRLFAALRPGLKALGTAAPALADAVTVGTPALTRSVSLNRQLVPTFKTIGNFAQDPLVTLGVTDLTSTATIANPLLAFLAPVQTVCNYPSLLLRNAASILSVGDAVGTAQRFQLIVPAVGPNSEGGPSSAPANGGTSANDNYLHADPYPNTAAPGQTAECESGNEPYKAGTQQIGNVAGNQGVNTEKTPLQTGMAK